MSDSIFSKPVKCVVCDYPSLSGFNYPDGFYCSDCGVKSKWHEKFSKMRASQIIKYLGIDPSQYGLDDDTINEMSNDNRKGDE